jgi:hypothetical protein
LVPALTHPTGKAAIPRSAAIAQVAESSPSRPVYPYSVIRGGAYSAAELIQALDGDPVAARHYLVFRRSAVRAAGSTFHDPVYLSYRVGDAIYWTSRPVPLPPGETLLTDGMHYARARCGNRISPTAQTPVNETEPAPQTLNTPHPPSSLSEIDTWSEDRLTPEGFPFNQLAPLLAMPVSAVPGWGLPGGTPPYWTFTPPDGVLALPIAYGLPLGLIPPATGPLIEPNPIPVLSLPPASLPPTLPAVPEFPSTPVVAIVPPNMFPPEIWPPVPPAPVGPGFPISPQIPIEPTVLQPVPEPGLLLPTLLAGVAIALAKFLRRS